MYILYGGLFTRALLVEMVMLEGDIEYELRDVDIIAQQHRTPEFLAINPAGWVPALITPNGDTLYETPAINLYLTERHRLVHLAPAVDEPQRGQFLSGLFYIHDELEPILKRYFYPHRFAIREHDSAAVKQRALESALATISVLEQRLGKQGPYHLGDRFSLVDMIMAFWTVTFENPDVLDPYPAVRRCRDLVRERPALRAPFARQARWRVEYADLQARGEGIR